MSEVRDEKTGIAIRFIKQFDIITDTKPSRFDVEAMTPKDARRYLFLDRWRRLGFWLYWNFYDRWTR